jgi:hypothetical protein
MAGYGLRFKEELPEPVARELEQLLAFLRLNTIIGLNDHLADETNPHGTTAAQVGALALSLVAYGTYTPTLTNTTNLDGSTAVTCQYLRVGTMVWVSGRVNVDPTAGAATELGVSLPVASDFANTEECGGAGVASGAAVAITADTSNNRAKFAWTAASTADHALTFAFGYQIR